MWATGPEAFTANEAAVYALAPSPPREEAPIPEPPLALSDEQITTIMGLARPLLPEQRTAFLEMVAAKLRGRCNGELGDGAIFRLCRELQRELLIPPRGAMGMCEAWASTRVESASVPRVSTLARP